MAKVKEGLLKGVSGSIGNHTLVTIDGETHIKRKKKNSEKSMISLNRQGKRMKTLSLLYKSLKKTILDSAFRIEANRLKIKSAYNLFVKENSKAIEDENEVGDYSFLNLSVGNLDVPFKFTMVDGDNGFLRLNWKANCLREREEDDLMVAVIYDNRRFEIVIPEIPTVKRKFGSASIDLYNSAASKAYVYCFFTNAKRDWFSRSVFYQLNFKV